MWQYDSLEHRRLTRQKAWEIDTWSGTVSKVSPLSLARSVRRVGLGGPECRLLPGGDRRSKLWGANWAVLTTDPLLLRRRSSSP